MTALLAKSRLRFARRNPVADAASLLGVALAVMAVVAVHLVGQWIRAEVASAASPEAALGGHTHVVTRAALTEGHYFELRHRWRRGELANVTGMVPVVEGTVAIGGAAYRLLGFDPLAGGVRAAVRSDWRGGDVRGFLTDDVVIAAPHAAAAIAEAGDLMAGVPVRTVAVAGTGVLLADLPTAQRLLRREGELDAVWLRAQSTRSRLLGWLDGLLPGIAAALPGYADPVVAGFHIAAPNRWQPLRRFADSVVFNLGALALLALLMAAFVAAQASFSHAARRRDERLRLLVLGVSQLRLRLLAAGEGIVLGSVGAALGLGLGVVVADGLLQAAGDDAARSPLDGWLIAKAAVCGVLASTVGPLFADRAGSAKHRWLRHGAGGTALAVALLGVLHGSLGAVFAALLAICLVQLVYIVPLAGGIAGALAKAMSAGRLLGRSNMRAASARAAEVNLALGALSVAAATAIGMGLMVESLRSDFAAMLEQRLWHGVYLSDEENGGADFDVDWIRSLPGVRQVRRYGDFDARLAAGPVQVSLAKLDAAETARYGFAGPLAERAMLNEVGARFFGMKAGDTVAVQGAGGRVEVEIAHVFRDFGAVAPRLILPDAVRSAFDEQRIAWRRLAVLAALADVPALTATLSERYGAGRTRNQSDIRSMAMAVFERTFAISRSLTGVALAVAAIGLYAALTALQAGREREFRLLSALGCSPAAIGRMALAQTTIMGGVAAVAAVPLGLVIAWLLCDFVNPLAFGWSIDLKWHASAVVYPLLLGIAGALAAGALPAYRASFRGQP